ncbi:unnamed protein product [Lampetra planeri]
MILPTPPPLLLGRAGDLRIRARVSPGRPPGSAAFSAEEGSANKRAHALPPRPLRLAQSARRPKRGSESVAEHVRWVTGRGVEPVVQGVGGVSDLRMF